MSLTLPLVTVEMDITNPPLSASPTWTDITSDLTRVRIGRGRQHELGQMQAGTCDLTVSPHAFTKYLPWNTSSPYYNGGTGLKPMRKVRVSATWPDVTVSTRADGVNFLTYQDSSLEENNPGSWVNALNSAVSRDGGTSAHGAASLRVQAVANGDMSASTAGPPDAYAVFGGVQHTMLAYVRSQGTGRFGTTFINWYNAGGALISQSPGGLFADNSVSWTLISLTATAPINAAFGGIQVYWNSCVAGERHYIDQASFATGSSLTWTAGYRVYRLFTGYVESFHPRQQDVTTGTVELHVVDGFKVLNLAKLVSTAYRDAVLADSPTAYYRMAENVNGVTSGTHPAVVDASGNGNVGQYFGSPSFGAISPLVAEVDTAVDFGVRQSYVLLNSAVTPSGSSAFTIEGWVWPRSLPVSTFGDRIWSGQTNSGQQLHLYLKSNGTLRFFAGDGTNGGYVESSVALTLSAWSHVAVVRAAGAPSGWRIYVNGANVSTGPTIDTGTGDPSLPVSTSMIGGKDTGGGIDTPAFDGKIDEFAVWVTTALSAGQIATHFAAAFGFAATSLTGARINNLLDLIGWPAADRVIDTGQFQMQPITTSLQTTSALAVASTHVESEGFPAAIFMDGQGRVVFQDRAHATPASSATFGDAAGELHPAAYTTWQPDFDDLDLWNEIVFQANNGEAKTAADTTSQTDYVKRTLPKTGLLNASDADVLTLAAAELARYKDPKVRLKSMTIHPPDDPANLYPQVLGRELNDRIAANQHTFAGTATALALDQRIEGIEHTIDFQTGDWVTQWQQVPT